MKSSNVIDANIVIEEMESPQDALDVSALVADIKKKGWVVRTSTKKLPAGKKAIDVITGMTIVGLALTAFGSLVSAMAYWKSTRPTYRILIRRGSTLVEIKNVSAAELAELTDALTIAEGNAIDIEVSKTKSD